MPSTARDSLEALLALGLAVALDGWDFGTYRDAGAYLEDDTRPIYFGPDDPAAAPDDRLLLTPRTARPVAGTRKTVDVPIAIAWRGPRRTATSNPDPLGAVNMLGLLKRRLHRYGPAIFGTIPVSIVRMQDGGALPADEHGRLSASTTYLFRCREATANA
jgi:hypothetical protein